MLKQKGGGLFGYTDLYGGYPGGQAQYVRVPFADVGPRKIEADLKDEEILFLGDKIKQLVLLEAGTIKVIDTCASAVRRGGKISIVGVYS